jgi:hypothetical protein
MKAMANFWERPPSASSNAVLQVDVVPHIRIALVADDGRQFELPLALPEWWNTLDDAEVSRIMRRSWLNRNQCSRFWKWLGRNDKVPKRLSIFLNSDDLERANPGVDLSKCRTTKINRW